MTDQQPDQHDPQHDLLRARLQAADPASSLAATDPDRAARLLEDVMSTELTTENRETGTHGRGPLTWLVAAAAVVLIAGVGLFAVLHDDSDSAAPTAGRSAVTALTAPGAAAYAARCAVPTAEILAQQSVAFDGTVSAVAGDTVTLDVSHWYAGGSTDQVRVRAPATDLQALIGAVRFEAGGRYLVSATDGQVSVCGLSAPYSADLAALYDQAFS